MVGRCWLSCWNLSSRAQESMRSSKADVSSVCKALGVREGDLAALGSSEWLRSASVAGWWTEH